MTDQESTVEGIADAVVQELRAKLLVCSIAEQLGPIVNLEAEAIVLSAVLSGTADPRELPGLESRHFYSPLHQALWKARLIRGPLGENWRVDISGFVDYLESVGWRGVTYDTVEWVVFRPVVLMPEVKSLARRLMELAERRVLLVELERLVLELKAGLVRSEDAYSRVRELSARAPRPAAAGTLRPLPPRPASASPATQRHAYAAPSARAQPTGARRSSTPPPR